MRWFEKNIIAPLDRGVQRAEEWLDRTSPVHWIIGVCVIAFFLGIIAGAM